MTTRAMSRTPPPTLQWPINLQSKEFKAAFLEWVQFRMKMKKVGDWNKLFSKQLEWLATEFTEDEAIASVNQSMRNGWTGLFPPKANPRKSAVFKADYSKGF